MVFIFFGVSEFVLCLLVYGVIILKCVCLVDVVIKYFEVVILFIW